MDAFPPVGFQAPVGNPDELISISAPSEGDRRFVRSFGYDYQFVKVYLANDAAPANPLARLPSDGTIGVWQPALMPKPSDEWILTASDRNNLGTYYTRRLVGSTVKSISFEVNQPAAPNVQAVKTIIDIPDFSAVIAGTVLMAETTVSNPSGYYGGPTLFIKPGGTSVVPVCVRSDGAVIIHNQNNSGTTVGLIRRVKINGIPAEPIYG